MVLLRRRVNFIKKESKIQEEIITLEKAALQAQMNPHFIFNSLNSIQKYILANEKVQASEYLAQFAQLIRLNLKASNASSILLVEEIKLLDLYLVMEKMRFKNKFNFDLNTLSIDENKEAIYIPPMLIQPLVENAILHGIAKLEGLGQINIDFTSEGNYLFVKITDNGKGIDIRESRPNHVSMGSKITHRRLELLSKDMGENLTIKNIYSIEGKILGVEALIRIKILEAKMP